MSLLDVFKDFEYQDDDDHSNFFQDTFSQLIDESESYSPETTTQDANLTGLAHAKKAKVNVDDFEEAFTVLKSIEAAHEPLSCTSINAFLHYKRNIQTNKRTVAGLTWPEHPETFKDSRLICGSPNLKLCPGQLSKRIANLLAHDSDDSADETDEESVDLCKMTQSRQLHKSLLRTVHSIYNQKTCKSNPNDVSASILDSRLAHSIARRTAFLLQSSFIRSALNRQSAVSVLKQFQHVNETADVDNVTSNWETVKLATEQLIGQVALDQETFDNFSCRLDETFK